MQRIITQCSERYRLAALDFVEKVFSQSEGEQNGKLVRRLVEEIRSKKYYVPELELIMTDERGCLLGYALLSRFHLGGKFDDRLLLLSPVAVRTDMQRKHVSKQLLEYAFERAAELGYTAVIVEGNPDNYRSRGFVTSRPLGITASESVNLPAEECLMVKELIPRGLEGIFGVVDYGFYESLT